MLKLLLAMLLPLIMFFPNRSWAFEKCVNIYYDDDSSSANHIGKNYSIMLANLVGHFPNWQRVITSIDKYKSGGLEKCQINFYIGSNYEQIIPQSFLDDYLVTNTKTIWMGYGFWKLPDFENIHGIEFSGLAQADSAHPDPDGVPGFYRFVEYKNEEFPKTLVNYQGSLDNAEISKFKITNDSKTKALAFIRHSGTNERTPWAIQSMNRYLFSEIPFSFISESDRYLVFSDLLFDILNEAAKNTEHFAVIRLEDIHAFVDVAPLEKAFDILKSFGAFPVLSLIPIFEDPHQLYPPAHGVKIRNLNRAQSLRRLLKSFQQQGATFVWHGTTHQNISVETPDAHAISGEDYEFWDDNNNSPVPDDSADFVLSRLERGAKTFAQIGIQPNIWLTPHYKASALDNNIFGKLFNWSMGRMIYTASAITGLPYREDLKPWPILNFSQEAQQKRQELFANAKVIADGPAVYPQFFPYEIYGDYYQQLVIPENLGNAQPQLNVMVHQVRTVEQILRDAKRCLVLRDTWASAFFHSYLLEQEPNDATETSLYRLASGLKELGFKFINLQDFADQNRHLQAPPITETP